MLRYTLCTPPHRDLKIRVSAVPPGRRGFAADSAPFVSSPPPDLAEKLAEDHAGERTLASHEFVRSRLGESGRQDSNPGIGVVTASPKINRVS